MAKAPKIKINHAAIEKAVREAKAQMPSQVSIPLDGTEASAVAKVKKQLKDAGVEPNDANVRKAVREARK